MSGKYLIWPVLALSACTAPENPIIASDKALPNAVEMALPEDIPSGAVFKDVEGCYAYTYAHSLIPLEDNTGKQICIP